MSDIDFADMAKRAIKSVMVKRNLSYEDLAKQLVPKGHKITTQFLANKISRGNFKADYLLELLWHLDERKLDMADLAGE